VLASVFLTTSIPRINLSKVGFTEVNHAELLPDDPLRGLDPLEGVGDDIYHHVLVYAGSDISPFKR
jgi:hypothetical protein